MRKPLLVGRITSYPMEVLCPPRSGWTIFGAAVLRYPFPWAHLQAFFFFFFDEPCVLSWKKLHFFAGCGVVDKTWFTRWDQLGGGGFVFLLGGDFLLCMFFWGGLRSLLIWVWAQIAGRCRLLQPPFFRRPFFFVCLFNGRGSCFLNVCLLHGISFRKWALRGDILGGRMSSHWRANVLSSHGGPSSFFFWRKPGYFPPPPFAKVLLTADSRLSPGGPEFSCRIIPFAADGLFSPVPPT